MTAMGRDWRTGELEDLFADLRRSGRLGGTRRAFLPAVDVLRDDELARVTIVADLAGVDPADVELALSDGFLTIAGIRRRPATGRAVYQQMELDYGPFERRVAVGNDVDAAAAAAEAVFDRGLLTVRLPIVPRTAPPVRVVITVLRRP